MVEITERLLDKNLAYEVNGNVYFSVKNFQKYGQLSGNIHESQLQEAVRVESDPLKRDSRDFTLWKLAEEGRSLKWPSPWGDGFPGWHIECSAMSIKYLGEKIGKECLFIERNLRARHRHDGISVSLYDSAI